MKARLGPAAVAVAAALLLSGCAATVSLTPAAHDATNPLCANVVADLGLFVPTVSGLTPRLVDTQGTAAWGSEPSVILRCGVPVPDPTTLDCVTVNGVDWLRNDKKAPVYVFTTYGRDPAVAITVDSSNVKADGNQVLTDVANAITVIPAKHHCVAPHPILQDGEPVNTPTPTPAPTATPSATTKP